MEVADGESKLKEAENNLKDSSKTTKENTDLEKIITKSMVEGILTAENFNMPAGYITDDDASYLVKVGEKMDSNEDIEKLVICDMDLDGLDPIRLSDVADVAVTDNSEDVYVMVNGNPAVAVTMEKATGFSTGDVTGRLVERFEELEKENEGLHISILMNQGVYIDLVVDSVVQKLINRRFALYRDPAFIPVGFPAYDYCGLLHTAQCSDGDCIYVFFRSDVKYHITLLSGARCRHACR